MNVKCDILSLALTKYNKLVWGLSCNEELIDQKIMNYYLDVLLLDCPDVKPSCIVIPSECVTPVTYHNCIMNILGATMGVDQNILDFSFDVGQIIGGVAPYTYLWEFDTDDFTAVGPINQEVLNIRLNDGKDLDVLVSEIFVTIKDSMGCIDVKRCTIVNGALNCITSYVSCPQPDSLVVINQYVQCSGPSGLILSKS